MKKTNAYGFLHEVYSMKKRTNVHNIIIELLTWLGIIAVVLLTLYSLQTLWIVIRYYYLNN